MIIPDDTQPLVTLGIDVNDKLVVLSYLELEALVELLHDALEVITTQDFIENNTTLQ
jgi:DNA-binding winged helix-turn-helix (wHTH) protein